MDDALKLDYLNGLLCENERARVEEHLAGCPDCRRELDDLQVIRISLAGLPRPAAPNAWVVTARDRLRETSSCPQWTSLSRIPACGRTNIFHYVLIAAGVTAVAGLLIWLVMGGMIEGWFPGLSTAALGISNPRAARTVDIVALIFSLHSLLFIPSIIENLYQLVCRRERRVPPGTMIGIYG